jgi:uncharacterized protein YjiS (DUF1127 family)
MQRAGHKPPFRQQQGNDLRKMIMSTISSIATQGESATANLAHLAWSTARGWWLAYLGWRVEHLMVARLRSMSDRQLKDIGVSRSQIEFAVRHGADRDRILSCCF